MEEKKYCPECGHEFVEGEYDYNYETGDTVYTCPECDWEGTSTLSLDKIKEDLEMKMGDEYAIDVIAKEILEAEGTVEDDDLSDKLEIYDGSYNKRELKRNGLCIVTWPDSQELCERENFWEHAWLINDDYGLRRFGSCAYVVEEDWYVGNQND